MTAKFCPACGASAHVQGGAGTPSDAPTIDAKDSQTRSMTTPPAPRAASPIPQSGTWLSAGPSSLHGRFTPGQMLSGRYRIVGLLGKGGMGEVYRADDLTLNQQVALKFLPPALAAEPTRLQRFLNEVRTTRQISHPAVCRVYDVGEVDGQYFLSMEYIDGEDLSSLLRRIGRLPQDKALEIARQICAGLAAAHDHQGGAIVHRDLKPANIMLDGRGRARITDFGVAGIAAALNATGDITAGTPAYMAPEQLAGDEITVRSDIYSLGLVLYELFTGKPAWSHAARSLTELRAMHQTSSPAMPSTIVAELDPLIERVILRCLERDPANRPSSALAVAAALPGGDPLAAALAAGETPSPEMVAASGRVGSLKPRVAMMWLGSVVLGLVAMFLLIRYGSVPLEKVAPNSPTVMAAKAREFIESISPVADRSDFSYGYVWSNLYSVYMMQQAMEAKEPRFWHRYEHEWAPLVRFFYRVNPTTMTPTEVWRVHVGLDDPPQILAGAARVELDSRGRLLRYERIPAADPIPSGEGEAIEGERVTAPMDWTRMLGAAGFDPASLKEDQPKWLPLMASDERRAWTGSIPTDPPIDIRIEAASQDGKPVSFRVLYPWNTPERVVSTDERSILARIIGIIQTSLMLAALLGGSYLSWRNIRAGRADRRGAFVVGVSMLLLTLLGKALAPVNLSTILSLNWFTNPLYYAMWSGGLAWLCYMAIEPIMRKLWPGMLVSWARVLTGRFRDPLVGRDLLLGSSLGLCFYVLMQSMTLVGKPFGSIDTPRPPGALDAVRSVNTLVSHVFFNSAIAGILISLMIAMLLVGCRVVTRNNFWASMLVFLMMIVVHLGTFGVQIGGILLALTAASLVTVTLVRFGLLAMTVFLVVSNALLSVPMSLDPTSWAFGFMVVPVVGTMGLALTGFFSSLGDEKLFKSDPLAH